MCVLSIQYIYIAGAVGKIDSNHVYHLIDLHQGKIPLVSNTHINTERSTHKHILVCNRAHKHSLTHLHTYTLRIKI